MTLQDIIRLLRVNALLLLAGASTGLLAAFLYTLTQPVIYSANATAFVVAGNSATIGDAFSGASLAKERAASYLPLINSISVGERVVEDLGLEMSPGAAAGSLAASVTPNTAIVNVGANASTPQLAQDMANAGVRALKEEAFALENAGRAEGEQAVSAEKQGETYVFCTDGAVMRIGDDDRGQGVITATSNSTDFAIDGQEHVIVSQIDNACKGQIQMLPLTQPEDYTVHTVCVDPSRAATGLGKHDGRWYLQLGNRLVTASNPQGDWQPVSAGGR